MPTPGILASGLLWVLVFLGQNRDAASNLAKGQAKPGEDRKEWVADTLRSARALKSWAETRLEMIRLKSEVARLRAELARVIGAQSPGSPGESAAHGQGPTKQVDAGEMPRLIQHRSSLVVPGMGLSSLHVAFKPPEGDVNTPTSRNVPPPLITAPITSLPATLPALQSPSQQTTPQPSSNGGTVQPQYSVSPCPSGTVPLNQGRAGSYFPGYLQAAKAWLYLETAPSYPGGRGTVMARFLGYMPSGWDMPAPTYAPPVYAQPIYSNSAMPYGPFGPMGSYGLETAYGPGLAYVPPPAYGPSLSIAYGNGLPGYGFSPFAGSPAPWGFPGMDGSPVGYAPTSESCPPGTRSVYQTHPATGLTSVAYCAPPLNQCPPGTVPVANPNPNPASASGAQVYCAPAPTTAVPAPPIPAIKPAGQMQTTAQSGEPKAANPIEKTQAVELYPPSPMPGPFPTYPQPPAPVYYQPNSYPQYPHSIPFPGCAPFQAYPPQFGSYLYSPYGQYGQPVMYPPVYGSNPSTGSGPPTSVQPPLVPFAVPTASQAESTQASPVLIRVLERLEALEKRLVASESTRPANSPGPHAVFSPLAQPSAAIPNP